MMQQASDIDRAEKLGLIAQLKALRDEHYFCQPEPLVFYYDSRSYDSDGETADNTKNTAKARKSHHKPLDGRKKDGTWDLRTKIGKEGAALEA